MSIPTSNVTASLDNVLNRVKEGIESECRDAFWPMFFDCLSTSQHPLDCKIHYEKNELTLSHRANHPKAKCVWPKTQAFLYNYVQTMAAQLPTIWEQLIVDKELSQFLSVETARRRAVALELKKKEPQPERMTFGFYGERRRDPTELVYITDREEQAIKLEVATTVGVEFEHNLRHLIRQPAIHDCTVMGYRLTIDRATMGQRLVAHVRGLKLISTVADACANNALDVQLYGREKPWSKSNSAELTLRTGYQSNTSKTTLTPADKLFTCCFKLELFRNYKTTINVHPLHTEETKEAEALLTNVEDYAVGIGGKYSKMFVQAVCDDIIDAFSSFATSNVHPASNGPKPPPLHPKQEQPKHTQLPLPQASPFYTPIIEPKLLQEKIEVPVSPVQEKVPIRQDYFYEEPLRKSTRRYG